MFEKFITKFKNILFFKSIVYLTFIALLLWLMSYLKEEYDQSLVKNRKAERILLSSITKLHSTIELKDQLIKILPLYQETLHQTAQKTCSDIIEMVNNIASLATKYKLSEKIKTQISNIYDSNDVVAPVKLRVKNYSLKASFRTIDLTTSIKIINDIYTIIPENSILSMLQIDNNSTLSAIIINKLTGDDTGLIEVKLEILIREISNK